MKHTYTLDGTKILREVWGNNVLTPLYDNEDSVCGIIYNGTPYYFIKNLQGDVVSIVDSWGNLVARYTYDAWGKCTVLNNLGMDISNGIGYPATVNPFRYRGYYLDSETGLYYLQSRYYDPCVGRFVNGDDPILLTIYGSIKDSNLYSYCNNNVLNCSDPTGHWWILGAISAAAETLVLVSAFLLLAAQIMLMISTPNFHKFWGEFCQAVGNGLSWMGDTIASAGKAVREWSQSLVKSANNALEKFKEFVKADLVIRTKVKKNSKHRYWLADCVNICGYRYVIIHNPVNYTVAKSAASKGSSIFTVTKSEARTLAKRFPGCSGPELGIAGKCCRQYWHYHILNKKYKNQHIFYLFS